MRLIDADALSEQLKKKKAEPANQRFTDGFNDCLLRVKSMVHSAPTIDAVPVVRCKDCRKLHTPLCHAGHEQADMDFCSHGERRGEYAD